ncbi:MAG TPA: c-type cytochrome [Candidatus Polarisedimenticolia bacterium]|nr:c-type cytochrome [Candidatus Polarisedimenticolia bacterium]
MNRAMTVVGTVALVATLTGSAGAAKGPDGKPTFLKYKCNSCHSIDAQSIAKKAVEGEETTKNKPPDLSSVGLEKKADWIALFLTKKEKLEGDLHPKKFRGTDSELKTLAAWLETMKAPKAEKQKAPEATTK